MSKFNVGDTVIAISKQAHKNDPEAYPKVGTIGYVQEVEGGSKLYKVQWQLGSTSCNDLWYAREDEIELFNRYMTNEEIWKMLENKMQKNGFHYSLAYDKNNIEYEMYSRGLVFDLIAIAYRSGYLRAMKGRPFKIGKKKNEEKKGGHWEPVDLKNLPEGGTKVRYKGSLKGCNWEQNSTAKWIKAEKDRFSIKFDGVSWTLDCMNRLLKYFDMWVEDDE